MTTYSGPYVLIHDVSGQLLGVSAEQGKPWAEVNYKAARLARFLESRMDAGHRIADAYCTRIYREVTR